MTRKVSKTSLVSNKRSQYAQRTSSMMSHFSKQKTLFQSRERPNMKTAFSNMITVMKSKAGDHAYICRDHTEYEPNCSNCIWSQRERIQRIEDLMCYATQVYGMGMKVYIEGLKNQRAKQGIQVTTKF